MTNTASPGQKTIETTRKAGQDLVARNELGRLLYQPGAYLADGAEYLDHAACRVGDAQRGIWGTLKDIDMRDISLLYPSSGKHGPVATTQVPFGGLAIKLPTGTGADELPLYEDKVGVFHNRGHQMYLHVGIPTTVYEVLRRIIYEEVSVAWCSAPRQHQHHYWMYAEVAQCFTAAVYVDGERKQGEVSRLLKEIQKSLKCDAFVELRLERIACWHKEWRLAMTIKELLVTDTADVDSSPPGLELAGRQKFSSPEIVSALNKLPFARGAAKGKTSA